MEALSLSNSLDMVYEELELERSARRAAEAERDLYRSVLEQVPALLNVHTGVELTANLWHPAAKQFFGGRDFKGKAIDQIHPNGEQAELVQMFREVFSDGRTRSIRGAEREVTGSDGVTRKRYFDFTLSRLEEDNTGAALGVIVHAVDVTDQVHAHQNRTSLITHITHDLRTPLNAILGFSELIETSVDQELGSDEVKEFLHRIRRAGIQMLNLINDSLDQSSVEAGRLSVNDRCFSPRDLLEEVVQTLEPIARKQSIDLSLGSSVTALPLSIVSDPSRIRQILVNLVGNALKFTHSGGVRLEAYVDFVELGQYDFMVKVYDTGVGIPPELQSQIFQPYVTVDESWTGLRPRSSGLGLSLSQKLATAIGGDLVLERSVVGEGSVFRLTVRVGEPSRF